jgi:allantoinase
VPGNAAELGPLLDAGAAGFKCFLVPSGVDEFAHVSEADLREAMPILARRGAPLLVHAELASPVAESGDPHAYATYLASRPAAWENDAIRLMVRLSRETGCAVHIVHLSSAEALPVLEAARAEGLAVTVETCPHYLHFAAEEVPAGRTDFKCSPPIRERTNRERLWEGLAAGTIDMVVSDHSPCTPHLKRLESGDFLQAWGGIASLQFRLPVAWTEARRRGHGLPDLARWLCEKPAELAGLLPRKGRIAPGQDADLVLFDPDAELLIEAEAVRHRHKLTPYAGARLRGVVRTTLLRGEVIYEASKLTAERRGRLLMRSGGPPTLKKGTGAWRGATG